MADEQVVEIGFLNIVATPHPKGVYERLLKKASGRWAPFYGDQSAALTEPQPVKGEPNLLQGQLVTCTDIDEDEPGINKRRLSEVKLSDMDFTVPANLGFNGKVFDWAFNIANHVMTIELRNEVGKTISPGRVKRILDNLLTPTVLGLDAEQVEVTVIPEDDALARVLDLKRLDRVEILVKRPNDDDITIETNDVMRELAEQKAKKQDTVLVRESGTDGLELNERNMKLARVAANNGYVSSSGRDEDDEPDHRSTKKYPKIARWVVSVGQSFATKVREAARTAHARPRQP